MKRSKFIIVLACFSLAACQTSVKKNIEEIAYGYCKAMGEYQFDDAIPYASKQTQETTIPFFKNMLALSDTTQLFANRPATITIKKVKTTSDTTAIALYHKHTPIKDIDDTVRLILEEGQWLVHAPILNPPFMPTSRPADSTEEPTKHINKKLLDAIGRDYQRKQLKKN